MVHGFPVRHDYRECDFWSVRDASGVGHFAPTAAEAVDLAMEAISESIEVSVAKMRAIQTDWHDMDDPQGELKKLRD